MSGTSLDGLDIALCEFNQTNSDYKLVDAVTIEYSAIWKEKLSSVQSASAQDYFKLNHEFGEFIGMQINKFLAEKKLTAHAIASHGHTVFHQPKAGISTQIGSGASIAAKTGLTTVCDFRSLDVALNGQGAPLVPIGDALLFNKYQACLNLGGIANISFENSNKQRVAFDICIANMIFNLLATDKNLSYDKDGELAANGKVNAALVSDLDQLDFYSIRGARSLGFEWFETNILPILSKYHQLSTEDKMASFAEHISTQIANIIQTNELEKVLVTGGGAFNKHLIQLLNTKIKSSVIIPESNIINFKEALIFAFLGHLRLEEKTNTLRSVTGALSDSVGGSVYFMKQE